MRTVRGTITLLVCAACLAACQTAPLAPSPTPAFVTATLPPTAAPPPSNTPTPAAGTPAASGAAGILTTRLNVRPEPAASGEALGMLENGEIVEVLGKDPSGAWYQIVYPDGPQGKGWVSAAYVQLDEDVEVPVIGAQADEGGPGAVLTETLNVRSRPSSTSTSLGLLQAQTAVKVTGKNAGGDWLQIEYPADSGEKGWITAQYVQASGLEALPVISAEGTPVGTAMPASTQPAPTFTLLPAPQDGDSREMPVAEVRFSPGGTRQFSFTGQVSAPEGDLEDWVAFTPYGQPETLVNMHFSLECSGRGELDSDLRLDSRSLSGQRLPVCGEGDIILALNAGQTYYIHFKVKDGSNTLQSVGYIITILNGP